MTISAIPQYAPSQLGLSLEDLIGVGSEDELREVLGLGSSKTIIHEICRGFAEEVRGTPASSLLKRERAKKVMSALIGDLRATHDLFDFRYRMAQTLIKTYTAFLVEMYSEPRT